nr:hypothetical protein [Tanacetum cinerariifolium]
EGALAAESCFAPVVALGIKASVEAIGGRQEKVRLVVLRVGLGELLAVGVGRVHVGKENLVVLLGLEIGGHNFPPVAQAHEKVRHGVVRVAPAQRPKLLFGLVVLEIVKVLHGPVQLQLNVFVEQQPAFGISVGQHIHIAQVHVANGRRFYLARILGVAGGQRAEQEQQQKQARKSKQGGHRKHKIDGKPPG